MTEKHRNCFFQKKPFFSCCSNNLPNQHFRLKVRGLLLALMCLHCELYVGKHSDSVCLTRNLKQHIPETKHMVISLSFSTVGQLLLILEVCGKLRFLPCLAKRSVPNPKYSESMFKKIFRPSSYTQPLPISPFGIIYLLDVYYFINIFIYISNISRC